MKLQVSKLKSLRMRCLGIWPFQRGRRRAGRALRLSYKDIPDGTVVRTRPLGLDIRSHPDDVFFDVFYFHDYERRETELMLGLIEPGRTVFDIGCNFGWFSLNALRSDRHRWVWAFEPQEDLCREIRENAKLNGLETHLGQNFRIFNCALGSRDGALTLRRIAGASHALTTSYSSEASVSCSFAVPVMRLDSVVREIDDPARLPSFIKCDVEGAEMEVLQGSVGLCKARSKPVWLLEINHERALAAGWCLADMIAFLEKHGYSHFLFLSHARRPTLVRTRDRRQVSSSTGNGNIVAFSADVHQGKMDSLARKGVVCF